MAKGSRVRIDAFFQIDKQALLHYQEVRRVESLLSYYFTARK
jgi:hypothetical protein